MKISIQLLFLLFSASTLFAQTATFKVNPDVSSIEWVGKKVTGSHEGTLQVKSGTVTLENNKITGGELSINMQSMVVTDIENKESNQKLLDHLTSPDFFGTKEHPISKLKINSVDYTDETKVKLTCDLTIKGITKKAIITAKVLLEKDKIVVIGTTEIDRTTYDIKYGSGSFFDNLGDKAINDEFEVKFKVGASK